MIDTRLRCLSAILASISILILAACNATTGRGEPTPEVRHQWQAEAAAGDREAQYKLGRSYCCGSGQNYNTNLAIEWLCRAAIQGHVQAQYELANIYVDKSTPKSRSIQYRNIPPPARDQDALETAYMWYTVAAGQGHPRAFEDRQRVGKMVSKQGVMDSKRSATNWRQYRCPSY
ncbi:tetratricopeptide repeat protein [Pseudomonadota bacterium]